MNDRERKTIRIAAILVGAYLLLFFGTQGYGALKDAADEAGELEMAKAEAATEFLRAQKTVRRYRELRDRWHLEPVGPREEPLVSATRTALAECAKSAGVTISTSQEIAGRGGARGPVRTFHLEGKGSVGEFVRFLHGLRHLGFPLTLDRVHIAAGGKKRGNVEFDLNVALERPGKG